MKFTSEPSHVCTGAGSRRGVELDGQIQVQGESFQPTPPSRDSTYLPRALTLPLTFSSSEGVRFSPQHRLVVH